MQWFKRFFEMASPDKEVCQIALHDLHEVKVASVCRDTIALAEEPEERVELSLIPPRRAAKVPAPLLPLLGLEVKWPRLCVTSLQPPK